MLRTLVLILILVNAAFWSWRQGWLDTVVGPALHPDSQHEPQRLDKQLHPEQVQVMAPGTGRASGAARASATPPDAAPSATSAAASTAASEPASGASAPSPASSSPTTAAAMPASGPAAAASTPHGTPVAQAASATKRPMCVEAGPFQNTEFTAVENQLKKALKPGAWQAQSVAVPGLWLVYMGPYPDADLFEKKQTELRRIKGLNIEEVRTPAALAQGFALGRYNQLPDAEAALNQMRNRGIRTARVVNVRAAVTLQLVRVPEADEATQVKLSTLKLPQDRGFIACRS